MFTKLLVANRGEIARRIVRTCRELGVATVAVHSDPDARAAFVADADEAVALGGRSPVESYLRIDALVEAALRTGAEAVHPGYGFLAENAAFARACVEAGLVFVGPPAEVIEAMGSKLEAKRRMAAAGVPLLPSVEIDAEGSYLDVDGLRHAGDQVGFPLLVKASAGGGGRGMRVVADAEHLVESVAGAVREAVSAFGDGTVYLERYVPESRHIEVQIFGDHNGRVVHLHERECSIQRRHQKIVEEAPSPALDDETRAALHATAVRAGEAIGYRNAGTVEFLLTPDGDFYFLEVNTRLQVEHPVTEAITGLDLVRLQLEVAAGGALPPQADVPAPVGHAIEVRLYAEDPTDGFRPTTGTIHRFRLAPGVPGIRVDAGIEETGEVSHHYDPMLAKVIAHAPTRAEAAARLASGLARSAVHGITTNRELLVRILRHPEFGAGRTDTHFLERHDPAVLGAGLVEARHAGLHAVAAALAAQAARRAHPPVLAAAPSGFRNVPTALQAVGYDIGGRRIDVGYRLDRSGLEVTVDGEALTDPVLHDCTPDMVDLAVDGIRRRYCVHRVGDTAFVDSPLGTTAARELPRFTEPESTVEPGSLVASMPGTVATVEVAVGQPVEAGDVLVVLEAMKMELAVRAPVTGTVTAVGVVPGQTVDAGHVLAIVEPTDP